MDFRESGIELKLKDILQTTQGNSAVYVENGKYPVYGAGYKSIGRSDEYNCENQLVVGIEGTLGGSKAYK